MLNLTSNPKVNTAKQCQSNIFETLQYSFVTFFVAFVICVYYNVCIKEIYTTL